MKVKILKDPTGLYNLSYGIGEVWNVSDDLGTKLIESKHAEQTTDPLMQPDNAKYHTITGSDGQPIKVKANADK